MRTTPKYQKAKKLDAKIGFASFKSAKNFFKLNTEKFILELSFLVNGKMSIYQKN